MKSAGMRTLDKYIVRSFVSTALMFFVVMMLLRVVADLFVNLDEFLEAQQGMADRVRFIVEYYAYQSTAYFIELGGVIIVAAAVFTLARMNHTNELTAMLASGVSLHRVVLPIVICAMALGLLVIVDQEVVIPRVADKLVRSRDEAAVTDNEFPVRLPSDGQGTIFYADTYDPAEQVMTDPVIIPRDEQFAALLRISGTQARPLRHGWQVEGAVLAATSKLDVIWPNSPDTQRVYATIGAPQLLRQAQDTYRRVNGREIALADISGASDVNVQDAAYGMTIEAERFEPRRPAAPSGPWGGQLIKPKFSYVTPNGRVLGQFVAAAAEWMTDEKLGDRWELTDGAFFVPSDMTAEDLVLWESGRQLNYMSTADLTRAISLGRVQDVRTAELAKHLRFTAPINNLIMLLLGVPFILSRERNIKSSAAMCLLTVGVFFAFIHGCRQVDINPLLAAWLPVFIFGPASILMLDSVKT